MSGNATSAPSILALDISATRTGVAMGRVGDRPRLFSFKPRSPGESHGRMLFRFVRWLKTQINLDRPDAFFVEAAINPAAFMGDWDEEKGRVKMTSNPETTIILSKLWGAAELVGEGLKLPLREARVQSVRKAFIGHGNLKGSIAKPRVRRMCQMLGWDPENNDESDAAAVWWWAGTQVAPKLIQPITPMMQQRVAADVEIAS